MSSAAGETYRAMHYLECGIVSAALLLTGSSPAESLGLGSVTMAGALGAFEIYEEHLNLPRYVKAAQAFNWSSVDNPGIKPKLGESGFLMKDR